MTQRFEPSRFEGFFPQQNLPFESGLRESMKGSMSERKEPLFVPRLEIEGSKGSQITARSQNSGYNQSKIQKLPISGAGVKASTMSDNTVGVRGPLFRSSNPLKSSIQETDPHKLSLKLVQYIKQNQEEKCSKLLSNGLADIGIRCENDWTPLHFACWVGNTKIVSLLLINRADVNSAARNQLTPLMIACNTGNHQIFTILVTAGANLLECDGLGSSCLHYAAQGGCYDIVVELLRLGCDPCLKNAQGKLPEENTSSIEIFDYLKKKREAKDNLFVEIFSFTYDKIKNTFSREDKVKSKTPTRVWPSDFDILCLLGKGSFGQVYLVRKRDTGIKYAMKVLLKQRVFSRFILQGQNLLKYAMTERTVLSYINHPFIVGLHFAFQTSEKLCLILDYCSGGDLSKHLKIERKFSEAKAKLYLSEIVLAIEELHKRDIIYRDLKPDNVVLDADGHCKLTDFGLSKEGVLEQTSGARSFCGSIAYLAPEMLKKTGHGKAVDWYLLGVVFYEMLVGQPPFYAQTKEELFYNIEKGKLRLPQGLSPEANSLLIGLLEREPSRRIGSGYSDAEEIKHHPFFADIDWQEALQR